MKVTTTRQACEHCRTVLLPGQDTCLHCGKPVVVAPAERRQCPECGASTDAAARFCPSCGHSMDEDAEAPAPDPLDAADVWVDQKRGRQAFHVMVLVLGGLLVFIFMIFIVRAVFFGPDDAVEDHFAALADRDPAAALDALIPEAQQELHDAPLMARNALNGPGYVPPSDVDITSVRKTDTDGGEDVPFGEDQGGSTGGTDVVATVHFRIGGRPYTALVRLSRDDRSTWLFFHRWRLTNAWDGVHVSVAGSTEALINGVRVSAGDDSDGINAAAFAGEYTVGLPDNPLLEAAPAKVTVSYGVTDAGTGFGSAGVELQPSIKQSANIEVNNQIRTYIDQCAQSTEPVPEGCPFSIYSFGGVSGEVSSMTWQVDRYPEVAVELSEGVASVSTVTTGSVTGSGVVEDFFGRERFSQPVEFEVVGVVQLENGQIRFTPQTGE